MRYRSILAIGALSVAFASNVNAQLIVTGPGSFSENFDTLANTGTLVPWSNGVTIPGYFAFRSVGGVAVPTYNAGDGTSNSGQLYSFGTGASTDRTIGTVGSGTPGNFAHGFVLQNSSGVPLDFTLAYTGEQWRDGGNATPLAQTMLFSTRIFAAAPTASADWDAANASSGSYNAVSALDFTSPTFTVTAGPLNGNAAANSVVFATTSIPTTVNAGEFLMLRWLDLNHPGNDHGLGINNVTIGFTAVPEPASVLGIAAAGFGVAGVIRRRFRKTVAA